MDRDQEPKAGKGLESRGLKLRTGLKAGLNPQPLPPRWRNAFSTHSFSISAERFQLVRF